MNGFLCICTYTRRSIMYILQLISGYFCLYHDRKWDNYFQLRLVLPCTKAKGSTGKGKYRLLFLMNIDETHKRITHHDKGRLSRDKGLFQHSKSINVISHINKMKTQSSQKMQKCTQQNSAPFIKTIFRKLETEGNFLTLIRNI